MKKLVWENIEFEISVKELLEHFLGVNENAYEVATVDFDNNRLNVFITAKHSKPFRKR